MPTPFEQITSQAIALAPEDRARLADLLLASLPEGADEALGDAWDQEIGRRVAAVESGATTLIAATDVHIEARKIYQR